MNDSPAIPVPAEFEHLAAPIGGEAMLRLVETFGGRRLYIAKRSGPELVAAIGAAAAVALAAEFGGQEITVPLAKSWRIRLYHAQGASGPEIARRLQISEDTVWRTLRGSARAHAENQLILPI
jgi:Mor family transcriptional regulator